MSPLTTRSSQEQPVFPFFELSSRLQVHSAQQVLKALRFEEVLTRGCKIFSVASLHSLSPRMIVTFRSSAFNTSTPEKQFLSRRAYGSDLANWLIHELARHDAAVEPMIGQKDSGWLVRFRFRGADYDFITSYQGPDWVGLLERTRGIVDRLLHRKQKNVEFWAVQLIDEVLSSSELISDISWHYDGSGPH